jgi:WD40 repeat protein
MTAGADAPGDRASSEPGSPYVGLVPYDEEDAAFFFGREEEKRIVSGNLRASRLTLLYGESGVGKTSLLRAGVLHDLREQVHVVAERGRERAPFAICAFAGWRDEPLPALLETIRGAVAEASDGRDLASWHPGEAVDGVLRSWTERARTILVVLDQFEDYFLYHPDEAGEDTFGAEFPALVNEPNLRVNFLVSIREDALAKLDRFKGRIPRLFANYVRIEHLSRAAARNTIEGPVREWNRLHAQDPPYTLEPELIEAVIDSAAIGDPALGRNGREATTPEAKVGRVEAPFLQLVMERLWRATVEDGATSLTRSRLDRLGGAGRIVENHLLEALGALSPGEQAVAADVFRYLVTRSKTKIAHQVTDLADWTGRPEPEVTTVLDKLCRAEGGRILRRIPPPPAGTGATRYELFHDVLAEPILDWRREYDQERRRRAAVRRFTRIGGVLLLLATVFAALGVWALVQRNEARSATRSATSLALAAAAKDQVDDHVEQSLLLGLEAYRASPSPEASSALVGALETARRSGAEAILRGERKGVRTIAFSPDGSTLAAADFDGTIRLFDTKARTMLGDLLRGHTAGVWGLSFSPDGRTLASASFDGTVRFWDVQEQRQLGEAVDAGAGAVRSIAFSPDGRTLAVAGSDETVQLWDARTHERVGEPLRGHTGEVWSVAFSPDGRTLASAGVDRTVRLWDVRTHEPRGRPLTGHSAKVVSVSFSPDGRLLASSDLEGDVRLWNVRAASPSGGPLSSGTREVWSVAFSPDGRVLAASGFDGTVKLWDVRTRAPLGEPRRGHTDSVIGVAFRKNGTLASSSYDGTVRLWNLRSRRVLGEPLRGHTDRVKTVAYSPDGETLASAGFDRTIRLWDIRTLRERGQLGNDSTDSLESVAFSPDGQVLACAAVDGSIGLWGPGGASIGTLGGHAAAVHSIAFGPDGRTLAAAGDDGAVRLWDVEERRELGAPLRSGDEPVRSVAFSPDGHTLASASDDGTVRLWDVESRRALGRLELENDDMPMTVAFSPDGRTLASGSVAGLVQLWDAGARAPLGEPLRGHAARVESVAFGPDGRTLASASDDGTVRLWDVHGLQALGQPLRGHAGAVFGVAFNPDGRSLASGGDDRTVRLWDGILWRDRQDLENQVCRLVVGNLTESEWTELAPGIAYRRTCPSEDDS